MALGMAMNGAERTRRHAPLGFGAASEPRSIRAMSLITPLRGLDPSVDFRIANLI
jgi:hypothetical protein